MIRFLLLTVGFLLSARNSESPSLQPCGSNLGEEVEYIAPLADNFEPQARIRSIHYTTNGSVIDTEVSSIDRQGSPGWIHYRTVDLGRTWVKQGAVRNNGTSEFTSSHVRYRLPANGATLETSEDDGKHWREALLNLPGFEKPQNFRVTSKSRLLVEVAAIHPTRPRTLFACFTAVSDTDKTTSTGMRSADLPGIYVSKDAGDHWSLFSADFRRRVLEEPCLLGISQNNPDTMLLHGVSGLVITHDGGQTWAPVGEQSQLEKPARLKDYDGALARLKSKGIVPPKQWPYDWTYLSIDGIFFDRREDGVIYIVSNKGLYVTHDGGLTWCLLHSGEGKLFGINSLFIDGKTGYLFVSSNRQILLSKDRGCHFEQFLDVRRLP